MRTVWKVALSFLIWPISVVAQDPSPPGQPNPPTQSRPNENSTEGSGTTTAPLSAPAPIPPATPPGSSYFRSTTQPPLSAGHFTVLNVSAGFSVTDVSTPATGRIALSGLNVSVAADGGRRIGAKLDLGYALSSNASNTGHHAEILSYLVGPTISLWKGDLLSASAQVLAGGARISGPFQGATNGLRTGYVHYPAWAFGGSVEHSISRAFAFRVTIDCMRAHFFDSSGVVRGQYDVRIVNSIVYYLGEPIRRR